MGVKRLARALPTAGFARRSEVEMERLLPVICSGCR